MPHDSSSGTRARAHRVSPLLWIAALMLLFGVSVEGQDEETWYTVELIVFERPGDAGLYTEMWPEEPELPDLSDAVELTEADEPVRLETMDESLVKPVGDESESLVRPLGDGPRAFQRLPADEHELTDVWKQLENSQEYRPLLHLGWRQPGYAQDESKLTHVRNDNGALGRVQESESQEQTDAPLVSDAYVVPTFSTRGMIARDPTKPALDGTVRLHRARYLHVHADLLYYRPLDENHILPRQDESTDLTIDSAGAGLVEQLLAEDLRVPTVFHLNESRRMRSSEVHYLDHPLFGVLVQVRPYELPEEIMLPMEPDTTLDSGTDASQPTPPATSSSGG